MSQSKTGLVMAINCCTMSTIPVLIDEEFFAFCIKWEWVRIFYVSSDQGLKFHFGNCCFCWLGNRKCFGNLLDRFWFRHEIETFLIRRNIYYFFWLLASAVKRGWNLQYCLYVSASILLDRFFCFCLASVLLDGFFLLLSSWSCKNMGQSCGSKSCIFDQEYITTCNVLLIKIFNNKKRCTNLSSN